MYRDTLGWVHFGRGALETAMPYVEMAWKLGQHAEVGDHLAQISEKLGRRTRLSALLGDAKKVDAVVEANRRQLSDMRSYKIDGPGTANATAEFLVLFSRGPASGNILPNEVVRMASA